MGAINDIIKVKNRLGIIRTKLCRPVAHGLPMKDLSFKFTEHYTTKEQEEILDQIFDLAGEALQLLD